MGKQKKTHECRRQRDGGKRDRCRSSKRNRNRESNPQVPWSFLTAIDMIPPYARINSPTSLTTCVRVKYASPLSVRVVKVRRGTPRRTTDNELSGMISGKSVPQRTTSFGHHICSSLLSREKIQRRDKAPSARLTDAFYNRDK